MMAAKDWIAALIQTRGRGLAPNHPAVKLRKALDFIGRFSALLALLFICYGFYVEQHRSVETRETADQAKHLSIAVAHLTKENQQILRDAQDGRRKATLLACGRDRKEHAAIAQLLNKFHIKVPPALGPVDCNKRLRDAGLPVR